MWWTHESRMVLTYRGSVPLTVHIHHLDQRGLWTVCASLANCNKCTHHKLFLLVSVSYSYSACIKNRQLNGLGTALRFASVFWWTQSERKPFNIVTCLCCCKHSHIIAARPWWSQIETKSPVPLLESFLRFTSKVYSSPKWHQNKSIVKYLILPTPYHIFYIQPYWDIVSYWNSRAQIGVTKSSRWTSLEMCILFAPQHIEIKTDFPIAHVFTVWLQYPLSQAAL